MAISKLVTVWCNGCGMWEATGRTAAEARRVAKRMGWSVVQPGTEDMPTDRTAASLWSPGEPRDFCPDCASSPSPGASTGGDE